MYQPPAGFFDIRCHNFLAAMTTDKPVTVKARVAMKLKFKKVAQNITLDKWNPLSIILMLALSSEKNHTLR